MAVKKAGTLTTVREKEAIIWRESGDVRGRRYVRRDMFQRIVFVLTYYNQHRLEHPFCSAGPGDLEGGLA
jgi:hypothetical protein